MSPKLRTRSDSDRLRRRALLVVAIVVPGIAGAIALPRMLQVNAGLTEYEPLPEDVQRAAADLARMQADDEDGDEANAVDPPPLEATPIDRDQPHAGGDLKLSVALRKDVVPTGLPLKAYVTLRNLSLDTVHVPAPSEPQTTLRMLVLDSDGATVRDIVETSDEKLLRNTRRLTPGAELTWDAHIVAPGEEALPPGEYRLVAFYGAEERWNLTGLPMWRAPGGERKAPGVAFAISAP